MTHEELARDAAHPNRCETCDHLKLNADREKGHCYMFRDAPADVCHHHTGRDFLRMFDETLRALQEPLGEPFTSILSERLFELYGTDDNGSNIHHQVTEMPEIVAWDIYEYRIYGAPGEKRHRVLWVDDYRLKNGEVAKDLDVLLEKARDGGIDSGAKTIHVRALVYADEPQPNRLKSQR